MPKRPPPLPVGKPPRPAIEKGPARRAQGDDRADPDSDDELEVIEIEPETPAPAGERRPSRVKVEAVEIPTTLRPPDTFPSEEPDTTSRILATTTAAEAAEAERFRQEARRSQIDWRWIYQSKQGRWLIGIVLGAVTSGGWSQAREPVLAVLGIASAAELRASEDREAKTAADLENERRERRIEAAEFQKQINALTTANTILSNELATIRGTTVVKPSAPVIP